MRGFVYVISAGPDRHKIGMAANPAQRVRDLQTGVPDTLELIHFVEVSSPRRVEARAHRMLADHRVRGEWFGVTAEVAIGAVSAVAAEYPVEAQAPLDEPDLTRVSADVLAIQVARLAGRLGAITKDDPFLSNIGFPVEEVLMEAAARLMEQENG